ncbi:hypothetical protein M409DRAFT_29521 [Zasmidium cellare ATCC 36951]|uniref:Uncharacterized protein n=1 Tax=Zasmidium cellare ATCC 36951 TaxID=1080233 RepID=A0A6A6C2V9_ZASCE|nr:uncharacterized protein M409DRAFT_29521 [Zasmidium cellare ATCC 36951]KAF2160079.1 hypothetical protein M409DRAFT_29521 [Zasmidium cellare ATCC 36951]
MDDTALHPRKRRRSLSPPPPPSELRDAKRPRIAPHRRAASVEHLHLHRRSHASAAHRNDSSVRPASEPPSSVQYPPPHRQSPSPATSRRALHPTLEHAPHTLHNHPRGRRRSRHDLQAHHTSESDAGHSSDRWRTPSSSSPPPATPNLETQRPPDPTPCSPQHNSKEADRDTSSPALHDTGSGDSTTISAPRTPPTPSAILQLGEFVDSDFGDKVTQRLQIKECLVRFRQTRRVHKYGREVAEAYPRGRTPSPERERYRKAQEDAMAAYWEDLRTGSPDFASP